MCAEEREEPPPAPPAAPVADTGAAPQPGRTESVIATLGPAGPVLEDEFATYPLREAAKDPRWALWVVWIWIGFTLLSIAGILTLLILGWYYS